MDFTDRAFLLDSTDQDVITYKTSIPKMNMNAAPPRATPKTPTPPAKPVTTKPTTGAVIPKTPETKTTGTKK